MTTLSAAFASRRGINAWFSVTVRPSNTDRMGRTCLNEQSTDCQSAAELQSEESCRAFVGLATQAPISIQISHAFP